MIVVGISALYHDAACAVLVDGELAAAAQEERFTRRRFDPRMPHLALGQCLRQAGVSIRDVDHLAYYEDPVAKLGRQLWTGLPELPVASPDSLFQLDAARPAREIRELLGYAGEIHTVRHHEAHAASAFYFSGFPEAALLTADAVGEWATTSYGSAGNDGIRLVEEVRFPHSLGLLYSAVTSYLGFAVNSDEYKVMGLAPYGKPRFVPRIEQLITVGPGGRYRLDLDYFDLSGAGPMFTDRLATLLGRPPREPESTVEGFHEDVAASVQAVLEDVLLAQAAHLRALTGLRELCYAGGVALNCTANARLRRDGPFRDIFVQPAAGDAGGAVGAAALVNHRLGGRVRTARMRDARCGPGYPTDGLRGLLGRAGVAFEEYPDDEPALLRRVAALLADGAVVGWYQGRMEFGPRALGSRSILADPRDAAMRDHINALVKKREAFRPFAPAVVAERAAEFFDLSGDSPFMLETAQVRDTAALPAVTHVDGSARVQTVDASVDARFHGLLAEFGRLTGYPILLNTSFNMRGEPIVASPADALTCFVRSRLDVLVAGDLVVRRADLPAAWQRLVAAALPYRPPAIRRDVYSFL